MPSERGTSFPVAASGYGHLVTNPRPTPPDPDPTPASAPPPGHPSDGDGEGDGTTTVGARAVRDRDAELDEELVESFPTSDPPSSWSGPDQG
jgi:hypothetical protein